MKKLCSSALILLLLVSVFTQDNASGSQIFEESLPRLGQDYVPGEIIVKFKPNVTEVEIAALNAVQGTSTIYTSSLAGFRRLSIPTGRTVAEMVDIYQANANVEYAEANYIAYALLYPIEELYYLQWHLFNHTYGGIQIESAWNLSTGSGVIVAIVDTGIAYTSHREHDGTTERFYQQAPDLADTHFVAGYDFVNQDNYPVDDSDPGHGTHIAGIVAQNTNNEIGVAGIAFNAILMPVKVLDSLGAGTYANVAEGIIWATNNGAHIINLGLGGAEPSKTLENAVAYAYNYGVTVIAAAGNDGSGDVCYPAAYDNYVIAVGATRYDETLAYYSNYGSSLDLVAPGGDLNVDQNKDGYSDGILQQTYKKDGTREVFWGYCFMEGTSMAAAHVSGVAALIIASGIASTPDGVREALEYSAEDKGPIGWDTEYGWGIVNALAALQQKPVPGPGPGPAPGPGPGPGPMPLAANFTAEPKIGPEPLTVQFTDRSTGNITSWLWDFDDGTTSIDRYPIHTFQDPYSYTVSLTVTGPDGSDTETKTAYIQGFTPSIPEADFSKQPISMDAPMTVQFVDESTCPAHYMSRANGLIVGSMDSADHGGITTWLWDFGDSESSEERNPVHTYKNPGTYTVTLKVIGPAGSDTITKQNYITLMMPSVPVANFIGQPRTGDGPLIVQFTDSSSGYIESRLWNFGDGATSTEQNPTHTYMYKNIANYTVSLTVTGMGGTDTETKTNYIHLGTPAIRINIGMSRKRAFRTWDTATAVITVTQNKPSGQPISGVTIQGTWSGGYSGNVSARTDGSGRVSFVTDWIARTQNATFTIKKVIIDGTEYDFAGELSDSI